MEKFTFFIRTKYSYILNSTHIIDNIDRHDCPHLIESQ